MQVSRMQDFLGRLMDANPGFFLRLGRFETSWMDERLHGASIDRPLYISSLARSGTTLLLEVLARHKDVATHHYRDFPFVHIPVWWNWFIDRAASKDAVAVERSHKDGLLVTPDNPEAMEEILWMAFFSQCHDPAVSNVLGKDDENPGFEAFYRDHIKKLLLVRDGTRYLAKGNYNLSRLGYIGRIFADARFVVPVRDPVGHVASLVRQHKLFSEAGTRDSRVRNYMRRAGHFEFGLDFRPINFGNPAAASRIRDLWDGGNEVRAWAAYWAAAYSFVAGLLEGDGDLARRVLIVNYKTLCDDPAATLRRVYEHCELEVNHAFLADSAQRVTGGKSYASTFSARDITVIQEETAHALSWISGLFKPSP